MKNTLIAFGCFLIVAGIISYAVYRHYHAPFRTKIFPKPAESDSQSAPGADALW